ncbi:MAG: DUF2603 domain-containing protein [Campylobacter sp.]
MKNLENVYQKIDDLSEEFGIKDEEKTIFEIAKTSDPHQKNLSLKSGTWDGVEPWFAIDEEQNLHTMVSVKSLLELIKAYKNVQKELFELRLEKSIWQNVPIDFGDVWAVAMEEVNKISDSGASQNVDVNLDKLVKNIKKEYPNLFVNMEEIMKNAKMKGKNL